jgi:hypothetical protein
MLTAYGRDGAEARARAAVDFYEGRPDAGYWRRVLARIVAAR